MSRDLHIYQTLRFLFQRVHQCFLFYTQTSRGCLWWSSELQTDSLLPRQEDRVHAIVDILNEVLVAQPGSIIGASL